MIPREARHAAARIAAAALLVLAALTGCGEAAVAPVPNPTIAADLAFTCLGATFPVAALSAPLGAETADSPAALALRQFVRSSDPRAEDLPLNGYRVLRADADRVVFATTRVDGGPLIAVDARSSQEHWAIADIGPCVPQLALPGLHVGVWRLETGAPMPGPDATSFVAMVSETDCVSGRSATGRVLPPLVLREPRRLLVVFGILPPPLQAIETCPAPPPTPVTVELGEPLGKRELLDGSAFPPRDVLAPECCG